jgi:hypothetical protein
MLQEKIPYRTDWRKLSLPGFCLCMQASKTCSAILVAFSLLCIAMHLSTRVYVLFGER